MRTTPRENAALVRRFLTDVVAHGQTSAVRSLLTAEVTDHHLVFGRRDRREPLVSVGWQILAGAEVAVEIDDLVASGDTVAVRATVTGTHESSLIDLAPTGRAFEITYVWFCRIENGRIAELWSIPDGLGLLQQIGALPRPPHSLGETTDHVDTTHDSRQTNDT